MENDCSENFKSGFVNILGNPNVGKSTMVNALVGEKVSIVTNKAQTSRRRVFGIDTSKTYQIVYSDTPGLIIPKYEMQKRMMKEAFSTIHDADVFLWVIDLTDKNYEFDIELHKKLVKTTKPIFLILNKIDKINQNEELENFKKSWHEKVPELTKLFSISAHKGIGIDKIKTSILEYLPEHPAYFPEDVYTDKTERFFASEIVREKILEFYRDEIPYCCEVYIESFIEEETIIRISSIIYVERQTQKEILIGKGASAIKKMSTAARLSMEDFFAKKIFLQQLVKVKENWRNDNKILNDFGY